MARHRSPRAGAPERPRQSHADPRIVAAQLELDEAREARRLLPVRRAEVQSEYERAARSAAVSGAPMPPRPEGPSLTEARAADERVRAAGRALDEALAVVAAELRGQVGA